LEELRLKERLVPRSEHTLDICLKNRQLILFLLRSARNREMRSVNRKWKYWM